MDRNSIRKEIIALVSSIKNQSDILANEKTPSQLDLELFLHKVEKLYQKSIVFNHLSLYDGFMETNDFASVQLPSPVLKQQQVTKQEEPAEQFPDDSSKKVTDTTKELPVIQINKVEEKEQKKQTATNVQKPPVSDLKSTIGINDKFLFTNELFKGNMQEYSIAIQQLNTCDTLESAMLYFQSLQQLYNWDPKNETQKRLLELVDRRYS